MIKACDDEGTKKTLHHLLTREITHANMFMKALDQMGKLDDPFFGNIPPDDTVKLVFNLSQGEDERGPWNEEPDFEYVENPEPEGGLPLTSPIQIRTNDAGPPSRRSARPGHPARDELAVDAETEGPAFYGCALPNLRCAERLPRARTARQAGKNSVTKVRAATSFADPAYSPCRDDAEGGEASFGPSPSV